MILVYLLIGVMPLTNHRFWGKMMGEPGQMTGEMTAFKFLGAVCVAYAIYRSATRESFPRFLGSWQTRCFIGLLGAVLFSYLTNRGPASAGCLLSYISFAALLVITLATVDSVQRLRNVLLVMVGSIAFASLYVLRDWQKYHDLYVEYRPGGAAGDSNYFALSTLFTIPLAFYLALERRSWRERLFCLGSLMVTLVAFTLAASRGAFIGLVAACLFVVWRSARRFRAIAVASILILPLTFLAPVSPLARLLHPNDSDTVAASNRKAVWKAGWKMIRDRPATGVGVGNFRLMVGEYEHPEEEVLTLAHNTYIGLTAEMGFPALGLFLAILWFSYSTAERARRRALQAGPRVLCQGALGIQAGLIGYVVASCFISGEYQKFLWLTVFLSAALDLLTRGRAAARRRHPVPRDDELPV